MTSARQSAAPPEMPGIDALALSVARAIRNAGGEACLQEIQEFVVEDLGLRPEQVEHRHSNNGKRSELDYRLAWARTHLRRAKFFLVG